MEKVELLAPSGSLESLYAAVYEGADAVYMGGSKFSARAYASNFTDEDLKKAVDYCHLYGVKVYIALNTLIKEDELKEAFNYIDFLYKIGIDALIVQDLGIIEYITSNYEDFEVHASTQMTIHNAEGAKYLKDKGLERIVLSRELSLDEIRYISKDLNIETEIFVHGALCVCYSGQCLMSSIIGGRSGNRGRCAQPCRLPYTLINKNSGDSKKAYILSPKDICNIDNVDALIESGTSSLKIEGRMKRPEYVAGVVESYRKAIDNNNIDKKKEEKKLLQLFNREGFSKAYLYGNKGRDMMAYKEPKNTGTFIGKADKDGFIVLEEDVSLGDGIRVGEGGFTLSKIIKNNKEVEKAFEGDRIKMFPKNYKPSDRIFKMLDVQLMKSYEESFRSPYGRKIDLEAKVEFKVGSPITLEIIYGDKKISVTGEDVQKAEKRPLSKERIEESLKKSGDTPFKIENLDFTCYEDGFMPVSALNSLRREAIEKLEEEIVTIKGLKGKKSKSVEMQEDKKDLVPNLMVTVSTKDQLKACEELGIEDVAINVFYRGENSLSYNDVVSTTIKNVYIKTPNIIKEEFDKIVSDIEKNKSKIKGLVTSNLGIINVFRDKISLFGDYKLNIYNSNSVKYLCKELVSSVVSLELNKKEISNLVKNINEEVQYLIYGKPELMITEYCPIGSVMGGRDSSHNCNGACMKGSYILKDRMNEDFILKTDKFCRSYLYNNKAINLIPNIEELKTVGIRKFKLEFVDEDYTETKKIIKAFFSESFNDSFDNYTRGHFKRGVE